MGEIERAVWENGEIRTNTWHLHSSRLDALTRRRRVDWEACGASAASACTSSGCELRVSALAASAATRFSRSSRNSFRRSPRSRNSARSAASSLAVTALGEVAFDADFDPAAGSNFADSSAKGTSRFPLAEASTRSAPLPLVFLDDGGVLMLREPVDLKSSVRKSN